MARLPIPGSDEGTWGDILNEFLSVSLDTDGTIKAAAISSKADAADLTAHTSNSSNPHSVTKAQVGLANVDNTSDANKPISTTTQTALDLKANDSAVVHDTGDETIAGIKTFSSAPVVPDSSFSAAKLSFDPATQAELDAHAADLALHSSGRELAYAASTIQQSTTSATQTNITGLEITFTVGSRPVMVELYLPWLGGTANATAGAAIRDGSNNDLQYAGTFVAASMIGNARVMERITTPGTYTRRGSFARSAGTGTVSNNVNLSSVVSMLRAIEV